MTRMQYEAVQLIRSNFRINVLSIIAKSINGIQMISKLPHTWNDARDDSRSPKIMF